MLLSFYFVIFSFANPKTVHLVPNFFNHPELILVDLVDLVEKVHLIGYTTLNIYLHLPMKT